MCFSFKLSVGEFPFRIIASPKYSAKVPNWGIVQIFSLHLFVSEEHVKDWAVIYTLNTLLLPGYCRCTCLLQNTFSELVLMPLIGPQVFVLNFGDNWT